MEKNQIVILEDRGLILVEGVDAKEFLQNIISNNIDKVNESNSIFSAIFTPQGKYLYEFLSRSEIPYSKPFPEACASSNKTIQDVVSQV